jgi:hypothetical protein
VRRGIDAFSRSDLEGALDDLSPGFELSPPSGRFMDTQQIYRGREGFVDFWRAIRSSVGLVLLLLGGVRMWMSSVTGVHKFRLQAHAVSHLGDP